VLISLYYSNIHIYSVYFRQTKFGGKFSGGFGSTIKYTVATQIQEWNFPKLPWICRDIRDNYGLTSL